MKSAVWIPVLVLAAASQAATIVSFNSAGYTTAAQALNGWSSTGAAFDDSTHTRSPTSGYTGPVFYGGGTIVGFPGTSGSFAVHTVANNQAGAGGDDPIRIATTWGGTSVANQQRFFGLFVFNQANWADLTTGNNKLDANNALTVSGFRASNHASDSGVRFVIKSNGGSYYISDRISAPDATLPGYGAMAISDPASVNWFNYDPAISMSNVGTGVSFASINNNLVSVGFRVELGSTGTSATGANSLWSDFVVNASPIPEPASLAALGLAAMGMLRRRR